MAVSRGSTSRNSPDSTPASSTASTRRSYSRRRCAELLGPLAGERGELVQEHPDVVGVAVDHVEQLVAEHRQLLATAVPPASATRSAPAITSSITRSWMAASSSSFEPM